MIDHCEFQRVVPVRLGALEQILDMNVGIWKRVAAEYDVIDLAQRDIRPVPDGAEKRVIQILIKGRWHNQRSIDALAVRTGRTGKIGDQEPGDDSLFGGRDF